MKNKPEPKTKPKPDDSEQSKLFITTARKIGTDESGEAFERALKRIIPPKSVPSRKA